MKWDKSSKTAQSKKHAVIILLIKKGKREQKVN